MPVLDEIVRVYDVTGRAVSPDDIVGLTGLTAEDVRRALFALADASPPYFTVIDGSSLGGREIAFVTRPTREARQAVGAWPTPDALVDRMIAALLEAADKEPNPEKRTRLRALAEGMGGVARDVILGVASATVASQFGVG